ncbi:MAG: hypothetical protein HW402_1356 [Dehalococcoidales bacterium]|nr:hypothetical protein [Dehalococcoidales bacterium]
MPDLKTAITIIEMLVAAVVAILLGNYLGYKVGRWKLAGILGVLVLVAVIVFAIYAAIVLR